MKRRILTSLSLIAGMATLPLSYQACAPAGTGQRGSPAGVQMNGGTTTDNPKPTIDVIVTNSSASANVQLCLDEIHFSGGGASVPVAAKPASASARPAASSRYYVPAAAGASYYASEQFLRDLMQWTQSLMGMSFTMGGSSSFLKSIAVAPGAYTSVELRLAPSCAFGSLSTGGLDMSEPLTLRFAGAGNFAESGALYLNASDIVAALAAARNAGEVRAALASVKGSF